MDQAAPEPQVVFLEVGAAYLLSAVKFTPLTATVTQAFGVASEGSAMATAGYTEEDSTQVLKDISQPTTQDIAYMPPVTLAVASLMVALEPV